MTVPPLVSLQAQFDALEKIHKETVQELAAANLVLDAFLKANAFEEESSTGLVLAGGVPAPRVNPEIIVSITVNGKGIKTATVVSQESILNAGWASVLAEACMSPLGLLVQGMKQTSVPSSPGSDPLKPNHRPL